MATPNLNAPPPGGAPPPGESASSGFVRQLNRGASAVFGNESLKAVFLPVMLLTIVILLLVPIPTLLLDLALTLSIGLSFTLLLVVMLLRNPLELSAFPMILLMATLFRLGLNVASTRLILSEGHEGPQAAGQVIQAFGTFMAAGNYVTGVIIFSILVLINFIVITRGAGRIAEVAARFSLDALPGKQMAIDADMTSGFIDENTARKRRSDLEKTSSFFGAMDGASKFVRGDAIAGLLITFINIVGGFIIGIAQQGLSLGAAAQNYTLLTIGDGLVTQVPALLVSTAAGFLVTESSDTDHTAQKALASQIGAHPSALYVASGVLLFMALIPGVPLFPFLAIGGLAGGLGWWLARAKVREQQASATPTQPTDEKKQEDSIASVLRMDYLRLELGYGLLNLLGPDHDDQLPKQIRTLRKNLASDYGFVMPALRIQDNLQLPPTGYEIRLKEIKAGSGELRPNMLLVMDPNHQPIEIPGEDTTEPIFGLPAKWIQANLQEEAMFQGCTVVDGPTIIVTHLTEIVKENMASLLSYAETRNLLNGMSDETKKILDDIIPSQVSYSFIQRLLQSLLAEKISIRDLPTILEALCEVLPVSKVLSVATEHIRSKLSLQICSQFSNDQGVLHLMTLSPVWEKRFAEAVVGDGGERQLAMPPSQVQEFMTRLRGVFEQQTSRGVTPVLLVPPTLRPWVRGLTERFRLQIAVLSQAEIHPRAKIQTVGQV